MKKVRNLPLAWRLIMVVAGGAFLPSCAETEFIAHTAKRIGVSQEEAAAGPGLYKVGNPYQIAGTWYYPAVDYNYEETGIASWYGSDFHGKSTANGEKYDMNALSAAHRTLPLPSFVRVTNLENGRSVILRVNDRGPFARGRIIDVSRRSAQLLGFDGKGTARVNVSILADESRAIATQMQRGTVQVASADSPLAVDRIPKPSVNSESLPPPPGAKVAAGRPAPKLPSAQPAPPRDDTPLDTGALANPVVDAVATVAVAPTQIFIQAGAYSVYDNANRAAARLTNVGNVGIASALVNNRDVYRVRVGPLASVEEADTALEQVMRAGYNDARIVVVQ
ncbi:septal ring lytic transglycosylase RlpA family protein [Shumkonia mesophila]|uniref:septal ring lytic transglycosylase RlpA family protein n=1 Tax=Shumkonia mesophila TaxID=2838854 RepID=UPI002934B05C|nr:septal ring lytic transglycosylase RlpA family protein [Shumkonia mesophila]